MLTRHEAWLAARGASPASVEYQSRLLRTLIRAAGRQDLAQYIGPRRRRRALRPSGPAWTFDDVRRLYAAADAATGPAVDQYTPAEFWRAMITLTWHTGARHGRLLSLRRDQIDLTAGVVDIGARRFRLPANAIEVLAPFANRRTGELFGWRFHRKTFRKHFARIVATAGIVARSPNDDAPSRNDEQFDRIRCAGAALIAEGVGYADRRLVLTADGYTLTSGYRLEARHAPIVDAGWWLPPLTTAERDENSCRKDFTPLEKVAMGKALEEIERPKAKERKKRKPKAQRFVQKTLLNRVAITPKCATLSAPPWGSADRRIRRLRRRLNSLTPATSPAPCSQSASPSTPHCDICVV
jgi:hypothetical protein